MALQSSGAISLNDIHIEAGGSSGTNCTINDSDIRALISKGSGVQMSFSEWYGATAEVTYTLSNGNTGVSVANAFSGTYYSNVAKRLIIPSGAEIGGTSTQYAIIVASGMGGTLTIQNNGIISGAGGAGSTSVNSTGGNGGGAIYIGSNNVTVTNTGTIRGGGGGGGKGANGSAGTTTPFGSAGTCYGGSAGSGGNGGNGQGYNQSQSNGSGGTGGGSRYANPSVLYNMCDAQGLFSDGSGGSSGGNGGSYGNAGTAGGGGGSQPGSAGPAIFEASGISYSLASNSGTILGTH